MNDATGDIMNTYTDNSFIVRSSGGVWFGRGTWAYIRPEAFIATDTGGYLSTGGVWTNSFDKALGENFTPADATEVLEKLAAMPVNTWNYRAEGRKTRHIGPTAQDFKAAFGLGSGEKAIGTIDADGVALAAIQGLYKMVREEKAKNADLQRQIDELRRLVASLMKKD